VHPAFHVGGSSFVENAEPVYTAWEEYGVDDFEGWQLLPDGDPHANYSPDGSLGYASGVPGAVTTLIYYLSRQYQLLRSFVHPSSPGQSPPVV